MEDISLVINLLQHRVSAQEWDVLEKVFSYVPPDQEVDLNQSFVHVGDNARKCRIKQFFEDHSIPAREPLPSGFERAEFVSF